MAAAGSQLRSFECDKQRYTPLRNFLWIPQIAPMISAISHWTLGRSWKFSYSVNKNMGGLAVGCFLVKVTWMDWDWELWAVVLQIKRAQTEHKTTKNKNNFNGPRIYLYNYICIYVYVNMHIQKRPSGAYPSLGARPPADYPSRPEQTSRHVAV